MKVWYRTIFSLEKNFGKALNEECSLIPDGDWICITDGDAMFLQSPWGRQINDIVNGPGSKYSLLGCVTNRLSKLNQRPFPDDFANPDVLYHYKVSEKLYNEKLLSVTPTAKPIAGLCMLFPKRTWLHTKFNENTMFFDSQFSKDIMRKGGRLGIMDGLYLFHYYRFHQPHPERHTEHLE